MDALSQGLDKRRGSCNRGVGLRLVSGGRVDSDTNFRNMSEQVLGSTKIQKAILALLARDFYEKHGRGDAA